jgi:hydrogenase nickel incorporation protein HypA/HybF
MHEMALSESIIGILETEAVRNNFARVKKVFLEIGPFSGVEVEALRFSFEVVARGTIAENADLEIETPEAQAHCFVCDTYIHLKNRYDACPRCGGHQLHMTSGEEMKIKELEVE